MKDQGFGTTPKARLLSPRSFPLVIWNIYVLKSSKGSCVNVATVSPPLQVSNQPPGFGEHVKSTEEVFIASLNVTTMLAVCATFRLPFAGVVEIMVGTCISSVVNDHGFGTIPAAKSLSAISFPPVISNV